VQTRILKWILDKEGVKHRLDLTGSIYGSVAGSCEHNNKSKEFHKGR